jgi:DNA-binding winged helix-turn-helix (wHTH) protein
MENYQRYAPSYRATETRQVMDWIKTGQCGCIVGLKGSGKSNFIRFLLRIDTQQQFLTPDQSNFIFSLINLLSLTEHSEWGVYEMLLNSLLDQFPLSGMPQEAILELRNSQQEIIRTRDVLMAKRAVERCVALLCQQASRQVVLFFDEFDAVFQQLPASLFRCLRAIRDSHKDQVSYVVVATHDLADLRNDLADEVDHFYRLVSHNTCWLGPYTEADALQMAGYLASRRALTLNDRDAAGLFQLSGGHSGVLKIIFNLVWNKENSPGLLTKADATFAHAPEIERQWQKIWDSLSTSEKAGLFAFSHGDPLDELALRHLSERGLLRRNNANTLTIFSPLLTSFVQAQTPPPRMGTYLIRSPRIVEIEGKRINTLTELEFELLFYLYERHDQICTKNDLIGKVYQQRYDATSDEMLQALVSRLRKKIEPDIQHHRFITTVHGEGYKFILPNLS